MKFVYVILHYKTAEDTKKCVLSILNSDEGCEIVIVDNFSNNGSLEQLEKLFVADQRISFVKNTENLGFAGGNNVGYQYAKYKLKADFIAVSNNDIVIETKQMSKKFESLYLDEHYYIAGPDIVSLVDHGHQSPIRSKVWNEKETIKEIRRYQFLYFLSRLNLYDKLKKVKGDEKKVISKVAPKQILSDVVLHGAFIVFSPNFVKIENEAFRPGTFLYMEEKILYQYCMNKGYKMVFTPFIQVLHKEDSSTNTLFHAVKEKREFVFKNIIQSLKVYIEYMKEK